MSFSSQQQHFHHIPELVPTVKDSNRGGTRRFGKPCGQNKELL